MSVQDTMTQQYTGAKQQILTSAKVPKEEHKNHLFPIHSNTKLTMYSYAGGGKA